MIEVPLHVTSEMAKVGPSGVAQLDSQSGIPVVPVDTPTGIPVVPEVGPSFGFLHHRILHSQNPVASY
jgi:hypothetical protein